MRCKWANPYCLLITRINSRVLNTHTKQFARAVLPTFPDLPPLREVPGHTSHFLPGIYYSFCLKYQILSTLMSLFPTQLIQPLGWPFESSQTSSFDKKSWSAPTVKAIDAQIEPVVQIGEREEENVQLIISRSYLVSHTSRTHLKVNKAALPSCD